MPGREAGREQVMGLSACLRMRALHNAGRYRWRRGKAIRYIIIKQQHLECTRPNRRTRHLHKNQGRQWQSALHKQRNVFLFGLRVWNNEEEQARSIGRCCCAGIAGKPR